MKTVFKYTFPESYAQAAIRMPQEAQILTIAAQSNRVCLWALVDTGNPQVDRYFHIYGTGEKINPANLTYIGTVHMFEDGFDIVWHIFEVTR